MEDEKSPKKELAAIEPREITQELKESYLDYAMSVIVARALPDVRDGLKPVHRRILWAMWDMGLKHDAKFMKSAKVVGECLGKYHPHGDLALYDAIVRMAQDFSLRYPLVQGQGNFGSIDGDGAAAHRYTEMRMSKVAEELLIDIDKETVDWTPNYDNSLEEPRVLPAKLPNLLINGSVGIAVGMATNIPPHNLTEVIDATALLLEKPKATVSDIMEIIKGPDFPTGGVIYDRKAIQEAYATGRGAIATRGLAEIVEAKNKQPASLSTRPAEDTESKRARGASRGGYHIVITEIPYQVNRAELIIKIAELIQEKKIEGIRDVRDESDKATRIVIELKTDVPPQKILNQLYKHTDLQKDFHLNLIALEGGIQPRLMSIKDVLEYYILHRKEVVRRRAEFDLKKAKEREHILEGLAKALASIDKIIATIKKSADKEEAHRNLVKNFKLSAIQATAILEMRLQALAALERQKIEEELKEKRKLIRDLELLLKSPEKMAGVIKDELKELKEKFGDLRRTKIVAGGLKEFSDEDLVPQEEAVITLSSSGYIKRTSPDTFRSQRRGGKGLIGSEVGEDDFVNHFVNANTHDNILFFTDHGRAFQTKVYEIPVGNRTSKGKAVHNFLEIPTTENISAVIGYPAERNKDGAGGYLVMATKNGVIKKTKLEDFANVRRSGIIALTLKKGDFLKWASLSSGTDEIIITTANGQAIRFKEKDCRPMGRTASGVTAIRLKKGDAVSSVEVVNQETAKSKEVRLLTVMANGFAKQTLLKEYKVQRRGGSGIKTAKITSKTGPIAAAKAVSDEEELLALSSKGQIIKTKLGTVRLAGRATQGVKIITLKPGDKVAGIVCL